MEPMRNSEIYILLNLLKNSIPVLDDTRWKAQAKYPKVINDMRLPKLQLNESILENLNDRGVYTK